MHKSARRRRQHLRPGVADDAARGDPCLRGSGGAAEVRGAIEAQREVQDSAVEL